MHLKNDCNPTMLVIVDNLARQYKRCSDNLPSILLGDAQMSRYWTYSIRHGRQDYVNQRMFSTVRK